MTYYDTDMIPHSARLEYPPISENGVTYVPLAFLTEYMDMKVIWGEQQRIDITAGEFRRNASWGNLKSINSGIANLKFDTDAEDFWKENPILWIKNISDELIFSSGHYRNFQQVTVVGYSGGTVTISNGNAEAKEAGRPDLRAYSIALHIMN
jgi:hypothetical protein